MSFAPRKARDDPNQPEIVAALRNVGCSVADMSFAGSGFPDIIAGYRGVNYLIEIKTANGKLNAKQHIFHDMWRGQKAVATTIDEAFAVIGLETVNHV